MFAYIAVMLRNSVWRGEPLPDLEWFIGGLWFFGIIGALASACLARLLGRLFASKGT